jgi:hypothetical protein
MWHEFAQPPLCGVMQLLCCTAAAQTFSEMRLRVRKGFAICNELGA